MKLSVLLVAGALLSPALPAAEAPSIAAFVDVNVVPMDRERVLLHQTVLVRGERIEAVGPASQLSVPAGARRVEGGGEAWLLPGLADMHTHVASAEDAALYAAAGVTTVLQMGGEGRIEPIPVLRDLLRDALSPQVFWGFMVDGPQPQSGGWPVHSVEEARFAVQVAKERQYDFIKVYSGLDAQQFDAIVDESRKAGLPVVGHAVRAVGLPEGLFRGQVMVAHVEEFYYAAFGDRPDQSRLAAIAAEVRRSGAYVTSNLCFIDAIAQQWGHPEVRARFFSDPLLAYMSPLSRAGWAVPRRNYAQRTGSFPVPLDFLQRFVAELSKQGVPLLAGTDSPILPGLVPGTGLHEELRQFLASGLSNYQALAAATRTAGEFLSRHVPRAARIGVVEPGTRADLLLVRDNPLTSLDTLRRPLGVMIGGHWRSAEEIQAVLEENRKALAAQNQDAFGTPVRGQ